MKRRIIGLDPGLIKTGWGIIDVDKNFFTYVASGIIKIPKNDILAERLSVIYKELKKIIEKYEPKEAAVEKVFVNKNPESTLKLGMARGVVLLSPARAGLLVSEYTANQVKKNVVGAGHADKNQVSTMVKYILPKAIIVGEDDADALAVAICHANTSETEKIWQKL